MLREISRIRGGRSVMRAVYPRRAGASRPGPAIRARQVRGPSLKIHEGRPFPRGPHPLTPHPRSLTLTRSAWEPRRAADACVRCRVGRDQEATRVDGGRREAKAAWFVAASIAFLALPLPGCLSRPKEPLRIGVNAWPPFELLYLARSRGYFEAEHVEVDLVDFSTYTGILTSYHRGNIDGFLATLNEVQIADNFQDPPAVVLVVDYSFGGDALVARDGIADLKGLRGKRIAYEESALGSYELERILEIGGLAPGEITAVNRLPEEAEEDFHKGAVQGVITYEPSLGRLLRRKGARVLFSSREIPGEIVDVMAMRRSVLDERAGEM